MTGNLRLYNFAEWKSCCSLTSCWIKAMAALARSQNPGSVYKCISLSAVQDDILLWLFCFCLRSLWITHCKHGSVCVGGGGGVTSYKDLQLRLRHLYQNFSEFKVELSKKKKIGNSVFKWLNMMKLDCESIWANSSLCDSKNCGCRNKLCIYEALVLFIFHHQLACTLAHIHSFI